MKHLVSQLLGTSRVLPSPATGGTTVVVQGRRISDVRQLDAIEDDPDELARLRAEVRRAKKRASDERRKHDPHYQALRAAYVERTAEQRREYKRAYDLRTYARQRKQKSEWARRMYAQDAEYAEARRAATRAYYQRNRERILAERKAERDAARSARSDR